jgi:drug/metabolite transporter (DMT)-like permease
LVQLRLTIASLGLFLWLMIRNPRRFYISPKDIFYFIIFGAVGMASVQFTYLFAISKINVAAAILLQYMAPAFIAFHAIVFAGDKLRLTTMIALVGALFGCYLVVGAYSLDLLKLNVSGIVSGLLSAVGFAWYSIQGEYGMRKYDPWTVLFYALFFATLLWNLLYPPLSAFTYHYSVQSWGWIFYIGIMGTLLPFGLYLEGINLIRSTHASITATLEPITAGVISYLFLGEAMGTLQVIGAGFVLGAIILLQTGKR